MIGTFNKSILKSKWSHTFTPAARSSSNFTSGISLVKQLLVNLIRGDKKELMKVVKEMNDNRSYERNLGSPEKKA